MTTVSPTTTPTPVPTIHDAIDALFAEKEAAKPAEPAATVTPAAETPPASTEPAAEATTAGDPPPEKTVEPAAPKVSAADYAVQIARARKKLAAAQAAVVSAKPAPTGPSADAIKRAAAIEAAGDDPVKAFEAAGFDLATVVQAYDKRVAAGENPDPLAQEIKSLAEKLSRYEEREKVAEEAKATQDFFAAAETMMKGKPDYEYTAAEGQEGLELVKQLVLQAAKGDEDNPPRTMPLAEALKIAEEHFEAQAEKLAKTEKMKRKFAPPSTTTKKPSVSLQPSAAGAAPVTQTKPRTVQDVIETEINALLG